MKSVNKTKKLALVLLLFGILALIPAAKAATVSTDKGDYAPGETVYITGEGFLAGEPVDISISIMDDEGLFILDVDWTIEFADADGAFQSEYVVPEQWAGKTLLLSAMGLESGLVATVTFTDAANYNTSMTLNAITTPLTAGQTGVSFSGKVSVTSPDPEVPDGAPVNLEYRLVSTGPYVTYASTTTTTVGSDHGVFSGTFTAPAAENYLFRAVFPAYDVGSGSDKQTWKSSYSADGGHGQTIVVDEVPSTNHAPVINCLNPTAELGQVVGCLGVGTGFGADFPVIYSAVGTGNSWMVQATFTVPGSDDPVTVDVATVTDEDTGDTINVTLTNGTDLVTISGPGAGSADFSVDITADDGTVTVGPTTCVGTANAQIIYNFIGFLPPVDNPIVVNEGKAGRTYPIKWQLKDCGGSYVRDPAVVEYLWPLEVEVDFDEYEVPTNPVEGEDWASTAGGTTLRYDLTDEQFIYNWKTDKTFAGNSYVLFLELDDGSLHYAFFTLK